ncbi:P-loop containing nucleoside triphosphate hydrolase protein [Pelagophyceae sp. CCMP2097]|nr:P-loop containing nucleoside triphosphate hydrolase protein [Pelagophyceae sp. CCMP2097]
MADVLPLSRVADEEAPVELLVPANAAALAAKPLDAKGLSASPPGVAFSQLCVTVQHSKTGLPLEVLKSVSGTFRSGEVTAIMGTSGSGKTTLLDVLAGRAPSASKVTGTLVVAGDEPTELTRKRYTGYCEQHDTLVNVLTVREMLECTAELKCSQKMSGKAKKQRVSDLLAELGLLHVAETPLGGGSTKTISGGQRKRCNIGIALITKPPVLFLDEPTTGLDAATADDILSLVKSLARDVTDGSERVVACTLHSPSSRAFRLLIDTVFCLASGRVVWAAAPGEGARGPLGLHLAEECGAAYCPGDSLADHMMYVLGGAQSTDPAKALELSNLWAESGVGKDHALQVLKAVDVASVKDGEWQRKARGASLAFSGDGDSRADSAVATSFFHGVRTLLRFRSWRNFTDGEYIGARLGDKVTYGLILASLYWGEGSKQRDQAHAGNSAAVLWFIIIITGYTAAAYMPQLVMERPIFVREVADGCYTPVTFLVARFIEEATCMLPFSLFYFSIIFFAVGFQGSFWFMWFIYYLTNAIGVSIAYMVASFAPNLEAANALLPTYITTNLLFGGFLIAYGDIPLAWRWYVKLNFLFYGWNAMMKDNFGAEHPFGDSDSVIDYYDLGRAPSKGACIGILLAFFCAYFSLAAVGMTRLTKR